MAVEHDRAWGQLEPLTRSSEESGAEVGRFAASRRVDIQQPDLLEDLAPEGQVRRDREREDLAAHVPPRREMAHPGRVSLGRSLGRIRQDLPRHASDILARVESPHELTQPTGGRHTVGIGERDDVAAGRLDPSVPGQGGAAPGLVKRSDRIPAQHLRGPVGRSVVHNQDLVSLSRIIHAVQCVQAGGEVSLAVENRDHH